MCLCVWPSSESEILHKATKSLANHTILIIFDVWNSHEGKIKDHLDFTLGVTAQQGHSWIRRLKWKRCDLSLNALLYYYWLWHAVHLHSLCVCVYWENKLSHSRALADRTELPACVSPAKDNRHQVSFTLIFRIIHIKKSMLFVM